jgi:hypothetical protein
MLDKIDQNIGELEAARLLRKGNAIATRFMADGESGSTDVRARHQELKPRNTIMRLKKKPTPTVPGRRPATPFNDDETVTEDGTKERPRTKIHESLAKVLTDMVEHGVSKGTDSAQG